MNDIDVSQLGTKGEHIACIRLIDLGWEVVLGRLGSCDIVAEKNDKILRFQVKSTKDVSKDKRTFDGRSNHYSFNLTSRGYGPKGQISREYSKNAFDYFAFVVLTIERVVFVNKQVITQKSKKTFKVNQFWYQANCPPKELC